MSAAISAYVPAVVRALAAMALVLAAGAVTAQSGAAPSPVAAITAPTQDTRSALGAEREAQTQVLDAAERACYARFFTTNCLLDVARSRRAMQADIKQREVALNAADRQQRAQEARVRLQEKLQLQTDRLQEIDPLAIEQAQREKRDAQAAKQREHAAKAAAPASAVSATPSAAAATERATHPASVLPANSAKAPKADTGPSAQERAANQAAFDKKQLDTQRRMAERNAERAKAAASGASAPASLPLPPPAPSAPPVQ